MKPLIWIIDEEWSNYDVETEIIKASYPEAQIRHSGYDYREDYEAFGRHADLILVQVYAKIPADIISGLTNCKGIAVLGGGYERIDTYAAKEKDIPVTNVHGYCAEDIADYVLAVIYSVNKPIRKYMDNIFNGDWGLPAVVGPSNRIENQVLLVVGLGIIGTEVAKKALNVGLNVIANDPNVDVDTMERLGVRKVELIDGLKQADFITLHCNLMPSTENLIGISEFTAMKENAVLINTSRGKVINEEALIKAVTNHQLKEVYVDVLTTEPPEYRDPIYSTQNVNITPHISYISKESLSELKLRATNNLLDMYAGKLPADVVNL